MAIALPSTFPIVGLPLAAAFLLNGYQGGNAMSLRKPAGVLYPNLYASDAEAKADPMKMKYNCAQRAHANTVELMPTVLGLFGFISVFHPIFASASLSIWIISRIGYTIGYTTGNPDKRLNPISLSSYLGTVSLLVSSIYIGSRQL